MTNRIKIATTKELKSVPANLVLYWCGVIDVPLTRNPKDSSMFDVKFSGWMSKNITRGEKERLKNALPCAYEGINMSVKYELVAYIRYDKWNDFGQGDVACNMPISIVPLPLKESLNVPTISPD
jgi:hypothetical protein